MADLKFNPDELPLVKGRGTRSNGAGRFEKLAVETDPGEYFAEDAETPQQIRTEIYRDTSKTIISTNDSPDLRMDATLNPYRGCEHGCIYCYARPTHEYLGLSAGLDFESKIFAKPDAPALLAKTLRSPRWEPKTLTMSGVTDCYQPIERKLKITRACLEVLAEFINPVAIITKNNLVTRDADLLSHLAEYQAAAVFMSVTTLDPSVSRKMEPRASSPKQRLRAVEALSQAGIPVGVMIGPVVPGLTDHEIPGILESAASAGAISAHYTMVRLPYSVKDLFQTWLEENYPDRKEKVLQRLRSMRQGSLNDANFGTRMTGTGIYAEQIAQMMALYKNKFNLNRRIILSADSFRRETTGAQLSLF